MAISQQIARPLCCSDCCAFQFCRAQTEVHIAPSVKVSLDAERFSFEIYVMGKGSPAAVHTFASKDMLAAFGVVYSNQPKHFVVGPDVSKIAIEPDQTVPCGGTTAKVIFYFGLDENKARALFINVEPDKGVLLDCEISGQAEAIRLQ